MAKAKNEAREWWIWNCLRDARRREGKRRENHAVGECSRNKFILVHGHRPRLGHVLLRNQFCILMMQFSCYILDYFWDEFFPRERVVDIRRMGWYTCTTLSLQNSVNCVRKSASFFSLTSCAGKTCHARRELFVPKLQYFLSFKYIQI